MEVCPLKGNENGVQAIKGDKDSQSLLVRQTSRGSLADESPL